MARTRRAARGLARLFHTLDPWGAVVALVFFVLTLTPSLLPRTWFYQGIIGGWAAGIGYLVGLALRWAYRRYLHRLHPLANPDNWSPRVARWVARCVIAVGALWAWVMVWWSHRWQVTLADLAEQPRPSYLDVVFILPLAIATFSGYLLIIRFLVWAADTAQAIGPRRVRPRVRSVSAWVLVLLAWFWFVSNAVPGATVGLGEKFFTEQNKDPDPAVTAPTAPERSGSPDSAVDFGGVGFYGSRFVAGGASASELTAATGKPAKEPIRVYAGLGNAADTAERADLLISELERTHAQDRKALLVLMTTGTGWVSDYATQSFELLYGGDTAIAAGQYSAMPSALHFLAGGDQVRAAGQELLGPLITWWNELPEDHRPKLYLYGESLGTTGVEAAFSRLRDVVNSVDGILLTGPPHFNPLRTQFVTRRDPGSTETAPVYADGLVVRFANDEEHVRQWATTRDPDWGPARMLYVQHTSDPVAWWSFDMILREPDWLSEPAPPGHERAMTWMPFVSFLQVSADLPVAAQAPIGYGHNYGDSVLAGFAAIGDVDLTPARLTELENQLVSIRGDNPK